MMPSHQSDKAILDWLEENMNELSVVRDISEGDRFCIDWCASSTGCAVTLEGRSLRGLAALAMSFDQPEKALEVLRRGEEESFS